MAAVVMAFRTALVAEPALRRVEPVSTSGPVAIAITTSASRAQPAAAGRRSTSTVRAPRARAAASAPRTNGRHRAGGDPDQQVARAAGAALARGRRPRGPPRLPRRGTPRPRLRP